MFATVTRLEHTSTDTDTTGVYLDATVSSGGRRSPHVRLEEFLYFCL